MHYSFTHPLQYYPNNMLNTDDYYVTQEVIWGSGQPVTPALYTGNGEWPSSTSPRLMLKLYRRRCAGVPLY